MEVGTKKDIRSKLTNPTMDEKTLEKMGGLVDFGARKKFVETPANTPESEELEKTIRYSLEEEGFMSDDIDEYMEFLYIERNNNIFGDTKLNEKTDNTYEKLIKDYNIGKDTRLIFKNDPQEYYVKNISPNRKEVFVTINSGQTYRKSLKNITKVDNKFVKIVHENQDNNKFKFDKAIRKGYEMYQETIGTDVEEYAGMKLSALLDMYQRIFGEKYPFEDVINQNQPLPSLNEEEDTQTGLRLDKQIRVFISNFGGPDNYKKVQEILKDNNITFEKKVASFGKETQNVSGLLISTNLSPNSIASSQKYKGTVEVLKKDILKDFPQIKYREFKSLSEIKLNNPEFDILTKNDNQDYMDIHKVKKYLKPLFPNNEDIDDLIDGYVTRINMSYYGMWPSGLEALKNDFKDEMELSESKLKKTIKEILSKRNV